MPNEFNSTKKKAIVRKRKVVTAREKKFAELMVYEKLGPSEAARLAFGWPCEPKSSTALKAANLSRSQRIIKYKYKLGQKLDMEVTAQQVLSESSDIEMDNLRQYIYRRLEGIRDDPNASGGSRFKAINALEKMIDPAADINLIFIWIDLMWDASLVHCPCCHNTYPLWDIANSKLEKWRKDMEFPEGEKPTTLFERRMTILSRADNRKRPHKSQIIALSAPERNIAGLGAARGGKSYLLAMMSLLAFMIPGVEVWIMARVYAAADKEVEYLDKFLTTLFFPYTKHIITKQLDSKTEELTLTSRWGSVLKVRSAKAKGSITGSELEFAGVAEPGWVSDEVYNHLRARMTSRLGRTVLLGTPQGFGGILGRFTNMVGKDAKGRARRIPSSERTIEAGCPWNISLLKYSMDPKDNPEYVKSELDAARLELTDAEYASEFEGLMSSAEGAMFAQLAERHLIHIPRAKYENCAWVLGIDQGPRNFAAVLLGYDGEKVYVANEFFDNDSRTMKYKMGVLRDLVPGWIRDTGGDPSRWILTMFDCDPPILNELEEFEDEASPWPTEYTFRVKDLKGRWNQENWRKETYEYVNAMAAPAPANLYFDEDNCDFLHDQLLRAQAKPMDEGHKGKGWHIQDAMRGDHVPDAFVMAMFTILSGQLIMPDAPLNIDKDPYADAKKAFQYNLANDERKELAGFEGRKNDPDGTFEEVFGRKRSRSPFAQETQWHYKDY